MKILLADDDPVCRALLETTLSSWGYDVISVSDGVAAWRILEQKDAPLLAIVDWMMPKLDGLELCRRVRQRPAPYAYLVLVTARDCQEDIIQGIAAGADDYLTKPVDLHELEVRLRAGRRVLDLQQALLEAHDRLRVQATHDPLTGLWNRAWILDKLQRELGRSERHGAVVSVVLTDIDNFKHVNDEHGHLAGDAVLREIAQRIQCSVREYDRIGRYGGDEILVVLPECDATDASHMAHRIRERIVAAPMKTSEGTFNPTISMGVATSPAQRIEPMCMIRAADIALYRAKNLGRNCIETASPEDLVQVLRADSLA